FGACRSVCVVGFLPSLRLRLRRAAHVPRMPRAESAALDSRCRPDRGRNRHLLRPRLLACHRPWRRRGIAGGLLCAGQPWLRGCRIPVARSRVAGGCEPAPDRGRSTGGRLSTTASLTVVIPTYRRPAMLRRAIASVVRQRSGARVSVYDNGADRETQQVVEEFTRHGHAVSYHAHERNIGANANFAYALDHVKTDFFAMLSDDDLLLPGGLQRAIGAFIEHPQALFVASPVLLVDPTGRVLRVVGAWPPGLYEAPRGLLEMAGREHFTWTGTVFRRSALELVGNLDPETGLLFDLDFLLR